MLRLASPFTTNPLFHSLGGVVIIFGDDIIQEFEQFLQLLKLTLLILIEISELLFVLLCDSSVKLDKCILRYRIP